MRDLHFIDDRIRRGQEAIEKFDKELYGLTKNQLNWKPNPKQWSIAECLEHLRIADKSYFKDLLEIGDATYKMTFWEKHSPFSFILGKVLKDQMKEQVKRKMVAPKKIAPAASAYSFHLLENYKYNLLEFVALVSKCRNVDLDKTIINSPTINWITYSLRDALEFLFEHEHRHLNQAIKVKQNVGYPKT